jgi:hypothetical protein
MFSTALRFPSSVGRKVMLIVEVEPTENEDEALKNPTPA